MKKLNRKVLLSIFSIISFFIIVGVFIYNYQTYTKEYDNIYRSLNFVNEFNNRPNKPYDNNFVRPEDREFDNMMIMDYEVYTVKVNNGTITRIIEHGNSSSDFNVEEVALSIMEKDKELKIGNLYSSKYAYNSLMDNTIVIINTENVSNILRATLIQTILLFAVFEIIIYFISILITKWITKPAEESLKKQKDFIADASHELKTPLAVIIASSDELKEDKKNAKYIENIKYESERMNKLITGLLDLSKLENGVSINTYKEENISRIIEKISLTFEAIAFEHNITIDSIIEENILFKCNKDEIEKLISIIIDNAIKHSYKDSTISVIASKEKNNINIEITNTGDPIKPGDEEKIFERFYRADKSRNRDSNRYGLGLAIAKNIVTNHGGTIKAFSKDNKTTFKIVLKK